MSYTASLIKTAIKLVPIKPILWVANYKLKGIVTLHHLDLDLDARKVYAQAQLFGETEVIDVWIEGFGMLYDEPSHYLLIKQARSNQPWLNNLLARIAGKPWKIPVIPQIAAYMGLAFELFKHEEN